MFPHNDLIKKLKTLKYLQGVGAPRPEWLQNNRQILLMQIKNTVGRERRECATFTLAKFWQLLDVLMPARAVYYFVRPLVIGCLVMVMVFGSWVTGVSASYNSLPGDVLYPVKIATEAVQTTLAPNKKEEIKLRVEFATRRAEEVKTITKSAASGKDKKVSIAVQHLKNNLETVKNNLEELRTTASASQIVDTVKNVNTQTEVIEKKLGQSQAVAAAGLSDSTKEQVKQAVAAAEETSVKAVEVIVQKHEQDKTAIASAEVADAVDGKLKTAEEKVTKVQEQIGNLAAAATSTAANLPTKAEVKEAEKAVAAIVDPFKQSSAAAKEALTQAKEFVAQENFGSALDKIKEGTVLTQQVEQRVETSVLNITANSTTSSTPVSINKDAVAASSTAAPPVLSASSTVSATSTIKIDATAATSSGKIGINTTSAKEKQ